MFISMLEATCSTLVLTPRMLVLTIIHVQMRFYYKLFRPWIQNYRELLYNMCMFFLSGDEQEPSDLKPTVPVHAYCSSTPVSFWLTCVTSQFLLPSLYPAASHPMRRTCRLQPSLSPLPPNRANPALLGHPCGSPVLPWPNCYPPSPAASGGPTTSLLRPYACLPRLASLPRINPFRPHEKQNPNFCEKSSA